MIEDSELLRRYDSERSEEAFAELVRRHIDLVYSVALRNVNRDEHLAEDVTQQVFADLARKAGSLSRRAVVGGWLYRSAQFAASKTVRTEVRLREREREAEIMNKLTAGVESQVDWNKVRPVLDRLIGELPEEDRDAIWLRFFEGKSHADVGERLGLAENAVRMKVDRALDKLQKKLLRAGVTSPAAAIATALAKTGIEAAPAGLAGEIVGTAMAGGTTSLGAVLAVASAARLALIFALGLALGGLGRWSFAVAGPTAKPLAIDAGGPRKTMVARLKRVSAPDAAVPVAKNELLIHPPEFGPGDIDSILREAGLVPFSEDKDKEAVSWLHIRAPEAYLLKSSRYLEESVVAKEGAVDAECGPLFTQLGLSPERTEELRRTLAELLEIREAIPVLTPNDLQAPRSDDELLARMAERIEAQNENDRDFRERIHAQLGDADFARFESYYDTLQVRRDLTPAFLRVTSLTTPLTPLQRDTLVAAVAASPDGQLSSLLADINPEQVFLPATALTTPPTPVQRDILEAAAAASPGVPLSLLVADLSPEQRAALDAWQSEKAAAMRLKELLGMKVSGSIPAKETIYRHGDRPIPTRLEVPPATP